MPVATFPVWLRRPLAGAPVVAMGWLVGCSHPLPPAEYRAYLADPAHGLTHTREVNGVVLTCAYRPTNVLVMQDMATSGAKSPQARDSLARAYAGKTYCSFTLSRNNQEIENYLVNQPEAYAEAVSYLNTGMGADTHLVSDAANDSINALTSIYLRDYGTTGHSRVLLVFDTHQLIPAEGFTISFHDRHFGLGTHRFVFAARDLKALPNVAFD